jgi:Ca-activated chloride channel family protein
MPAALAEFHFLRPAWLWLALPAAGILWAILRSEDPARPFRNVVAPHLLPHLLVGQPGRFHVGPAHFAAVFLAVSILALAGPTWRREVPPFVQDRAALVVALDLSRGMDAIDVAPSRLERAKEKVRDLLALRQQARTALVAYAGTAHTVLPLTEDAEILGLYVESLATNLMPAPGKDAPAALALAESLLAKETVPGTILFVTDGIPANQVPAFVAHRQKSANQVAALGVGTSQGGPIRDGKGFLSDGGGRVVARLDKEGLETLARDAGAYVATVTLDDSDVTRIQRGIQTHMQSIVQKDQSARYRDFGWYLAPLLAVMAALWFRRGWTIRWATVLLVWIGPAPSARAADWRFADLWATRDQQGRYYFDRGDYKTAAARFEDPLWKGVACYRAADYACAKDAFARVDSPEAWYDLGNAYAKAGELKLAVSAYDKALAGRPGWPEAQANRTLVASLIPPEKKPDEEEGPADPNQKPDEVKFDDKGKKGKRGQVDVPLLTDEQIAQMWLRGIQPSPAEFLRRKFAAQAQKKAPAAPAGGAP